MDIMKKTKIEQYLQGPLWALLILVFVDIVFFFLDIRCGVILAVSLVVFLVFQMIIYSRSKQEIIKECMDFMFEQSQVQNYLLQQLPVPYALLDGNGMIIWSNDAFYKCHRSYLVHMPAIDHFNSIEIETKTHKKVPIARSYAKSFKEAYFEYMFKEGD